MGACGRLDCSITESGSQYWDLDIPGLNEAQARRLASMILEAGEVQQAILSDPALTLTLRLDRHTVQQLQIAITAALESHADELDDFTLRGVVEDIDEWLASQPLNPNPGLG